MNQASAKIVAIVLGIYCALLLLTYLVASKDAFGGIVIIVCLISLIAGFIGFILMLSKKSRPVGATIFISSALILLIGFGVCTTII